MSTTEGKTMADLKPIFYTEIITVPVGVEQIIHSPGAKSGTFQDIVRHANVMGYELIPFSGWTDISQRDQIIANCDNINDLLDTLEIIRVIGLDPDNENYSTFFPIIRDMVETRVMEEDEAERIVRGFTQ